MDIIDGIYINVGDNALYTKITGKGLPAVVIEPSWGTLSAEWTELQYRLSELTTVISYDRAGYGESKKSKHPRTIQQINDELKMLLQNTGIPFPYIFIGNNAGCIYIDSFIRSYPEMAYAAVFLDPYTKDLDRFDNAQIPVYDEYFSINRRMQSIKLYLDMSDAQFINVVNSMLKNLYNEMPEEIAFQLRVYQANKQFFQTISDEYYTFLENRNYFDNLPPFPDIPLIIINRDKQSMINLSKALKMPSSEAELVETLWQERTSAIAQNSKKSKVIETTNTDSNLHLSAKEIIFENIYNILQSNTRIIELG